VYVVNVTARRDHVVNQGAVLAATVHPSNVVDLC